MVHFLKEGIDISPFAAAKAVIKTRLGTNVETRASLVMKGQSPFIDPEPADLSVT